MKRIKKIVSLTVVTAIMAAGMNMGNVQAANRPLTGLLGSEMDAENFLIKDGVVMRYWGAGTEAVIPEGVTSIGHGAFQGCDSLNSVEIPSTVTSIGDYAFAGCSSLKCKGNYYFK